MYAVHHTDAVILAEYTKGETHKVYQVYTREFGRMYVEGTSIRKPASKMRGSMQVLSMVHISFIVGRRERILTNVEVLFAPRRENERMFIAKMLERIKRLVTGEEKNYNLFSEIESAFKLLAHENIDDERFSRGFEYAFLIRILHNLGYWNIDDMSRDIILLPWYEASMCAYTHKDTLVPQIKLSLLETGMY